MFPLQGGSPITAVYADDVFSTYLYTGNGSTQAITNGINLAGSGGMVWAKSRTNPRDHELFDSARGPTKVLNSNTVYLESTSGNLAFSSTGFTAAGDINVLNEYVVSWTFRKAPKFFDVVTFTGGANVITNHNLGSVPGMIIVKCTFTNQSWFVKHKGTDEIANLLLNSTEGRRVDEVFGIINSSTFQTANLVGGPYVAYLFADNTETDGLIRCGSFLTDAGGNASVTSLGWEPQFLIAKVSSPSITGDWIMLDAERGWDYNTNSNNFDRVLRANQNSQESTDTEYGNPTSSGFDFVGAAGTPYIYLAIRRPNKPIKSAANLFNVYSAFTGGQTSHSLHISGRRSIAEKWLWITKELNTFKSNLGLNSTTLNGLLTNPAGSVLSNSLNDFYPQNTFAFPQSNSVGYTFKRAPGFFDVVCYTGTGVARTVKHGLGVAPELMIVKSLTSANWVVWNSFIATFSSLSFLSLNSDAARSTQGSYFAATAPTDAVFTVGGGAAETNQSTIKYVAYLFATLPGISKVGTYTGNGGIQNIDCGFFNTGARFVLIKRTDAIGNWYIHDVLRGITSNIDPVLTLNTTDVETANYDNIDLIASGFQIWQNPGENLNVTNATYIYLAIA